LNCEGSCKVLKTQVHFMRLKFVDHSLRSTDTGNYTFSGCVVAHCSCVWLCVLQVRAVLAVRTRTPRMIQILVTMHIGVIIASLQVSY